MTKELGDIILPGVAEMEYFDAANITTEFLTGGYKVGEAQGSDIADTTFDATNEAAINDDAIALLVAFGYDVNLFGRDGATNPVKISMFLGKPFDSSLQRVKHVKIPAQGAHVHEDDTKDKDWARYADTGSQIVALVDQKFSYKANFDDPDGIIGANDPRFGFSIRGEIVK